MTLTVEKLTKTTADMLAAFHAHVRCLVDEKLIDPEKLRLTIEARQEKAKELVEAGMSQRQAAKVLGVSQETVRRDLATQNVSESDTKPVTPAPSPPPPSPPKPMLTLKTHEGRDVQYPKPKSTPPFNETRGDGISWAHWSWNPITGCLHGCPYCYAREIAHNEKYAAAFPAQFTPLFHPERLGSPEITSLPKDVLLNSALRRVFVCSMADLYGNWVPDDWIDAVHKAMADNPQWQYITLTKHPARYALKPPPAGAWVGASVDEQKRVSIVERSMARVKDAAVRWLSLEPLKADLRFTDLSMFDWIVIGAQTETRQPDGVEPAFAPPFEWVARLVEQAKAAGCRVHLKPNLLGKTDGQSPGMKMLNEYPNETPEMRRAVNG